MILVEKDLKIPKHDKVLKDTDKDKEKEKLYKANEKAYCELILACQGPIAFNIVRKCTTDELPTGNAYLAWNKLKERFDPRISNEKLQLKEKSTNSKLKDWKKSPDDWITELEIIVSQLDQMGYKITNEDFMMYVLGNLPEEYKSKVETLKTDLDNEHDPLTIERMTNKLILKNKKICKKNNYDSDDDKNKIKNKNKGTALTNADYPRSKGRCYTCGNFGHKNAHFPSKKNDAENDPRKRKPNVKCTRCGRWGHKYTDCWYYKKQQKEKNKGESANVTSETNTEKDIALITENPSGNEKVLLCTEIYEDVWIADSGASSHMTNTLQGMYNQRRISSKVKIGSGEYIEANIIGDVSGIAIQKDGTKTNITLCNIKYVPSLFCKLISLTTTMNIRFKMTGDGNGITIQDASTSYRFDQRIKSGEVE